MMTPATPQSGVHLPVITGRWMVAGSGSIRSALICDAPHG
jgi:hypothetical protein